MEPLVHGFLLAFGLILPLGVQNVFIFSQGAEQSTFLKASPAVITASLCDTLLILLAVLGVSALVAQMEGLRLLLMGGGVLFLIFMGYTMWRARPQVAENVDGLPMKKQVLFALSVSLLNPHAILDTVGVIGTSALRYEAYDTWIFTFTCIFVSWCWFFGLALAGRMMKRLDGSGKLFMVVNKCSAIFIWITALILLRELF
ncbi:LysE/ArgO family amino acid transporter [Cytobacillus purgationiresistens]|uniref:L-lysine exporter family protein LysE/ArgO n=1 Tax=Cytobacillus purgationiresistens TaxID=863449 RepID=A0ABU0AKL3_9BACI|nr:LysE/ArgO family amino acid transporter [Cytobacillus purgationiresistens]MDQ0270590.1 L-lysine exporter family protein LysE/ArgO [Cytobacillus purgationiresistens]